MHLLRILSIICIQKFSFLYKFTVYLKTYILAKIGKKDSAYAESFLHILLQHIIANINVSYQFIVQTY